MYDVLLAFCLIDSLRPATTLAVRNSGHVGQVHFSATPLLAVTLTAQKSPDETNVDLRIAVKAAALLQYVLEVSFCIFLLTFLKLLKINFLC